MNKTQDVKTECRRALEGCPHNHGTVKSICRVCLGELSLHAWDTDDPMFVIIDCPLCSGERRFAGVEVCPCLEDFSPDTIARAVEGLRAESADQGDGAEGDDVCQQEEDVEDEFTPLCHALKWMHHEAAPPAPVADRLATALMQKLRTWAEGHKEIKIPHPKATLLLHLLDRGMIEFVKAPDAGKFLLRAKGAKEEFGRFLEQLNRSYKHDQATVAQMLAFAYRIVHWEFDPAALQRYERGPDWTEIHTRGFDVRGFEGLLTGDPEEIENVIREACGYLEPTGLVKTPRQ